jgi:voltage-gated potassium channel
MPRPVGRAGHDIDHLMAEPSIPDRFANLQRVRSLAPTTADLRDFVRRLVVLISMIAVVLAAGTAGLWLTTDSSVWHSFVWALDTMATTGSIQAPTDTGAQVVKVLLTLFGVGTLFYALVTVAEFFVAGHLSELLAERRMQKMIDALTDHYIICGFGRVGRQVARDMRAAGARYVVVDDNPENREIAVGVGARIIHAQPSSDEALRDAGIERARAVVACVDSDAENIFITLTARELNPEITVIARAAIEDSESKLLRAGANRVISPYKTSGTEMARLALNPQVSGVVDVSPDYRMEEISVSEGAEGEGKTLGDVRGGALIMGVRRADGTFQPLPPGELRLCAGDVIIAMGTGRTMDRLERLFHAAPSHAGAPAP